MKKLSFFLLLFSFFTFVSFTSCNRPAENDAREEMYEEDDELMEDDELIEEDTMEME